MVMPFGKHKGTDLADIPITYLRWVLTQSISPEVRDGIIEVLKDEDKKDIEDPDPNMNLDPPATEDRTAKFSKREAPRGEFKINTQAAKINGFTFNLDEIRSLREVNTPIERHDCVLTHVLQLKDGCFGSSAKSNKCLWLTTKEAEVIEDWIFNRK